MGDLKLGRLGKKDSVDIDMLKAGVKQSDFKDKKLQQIFSKVDTNDNGIIEWDEMELFTQGVRKQAHNSRLNKMEAKKLLKKMGIENANAQDLYDFLKVSSEQSKNIKSTKTIQSGGAVVGINIEYQPDEDGNVFSSLYEADTGVKISDSVQDKNYTKVTTFYEADGETPAYYMMSQGSQTDYIDTSNRVFRREVQKAEDVYEISQYEYEDGQTEPYKTTVMHADGTITVEENGVTTNYNPDGTIIEPDNEILDNEHVEDSDGQAQNTVKLDNGRILTMKEDENGNAVVTIQENENSEPVEIHYDENGNIISHAKEGETFAQTAKRLGIEKGTPEYEKFKELNAKAAKNGWFQVGAEVKIPAGMEEKINLDGLNVDVQQEINKYIERVQTPSVNPAEPEAPAEDTPSGQAAPESPETIETPETQQPSAPDSVEEPQPVEEPTSDPEPAPAEDNPAPQENNPEPSDTPSRPAKDIAQSLKDDIYAKTILGLPTTGEDIAKHIAEINADNVNEVMAAYQKINSDDENLMEAIIKERGLPTEVRAEYLTHIKDALVEAAKQKGVYADDISKDFDKEIKYQMEKFGLASATYINSFLEKLNDRIKMKDDAWISKPNGKIDEKFGQGNTGDCWLLASIQALAQSPKGLEILNDLVSVDESGNVTVTLKGAGKSYIITPEELAGNQQLGSGDADVRAIEIAMDRYFMEERGINNWSLWNPATRYDLNGNNANIAFEILTGEGGRNFLTNSLFGRLPDFWFTDSQIDNFNKENHIAVVGAHLKGDLTFAASDGTGDITLHTDHAYAVKGADEKNVFLVNPWDTSKVITVPREIFKDFFNSIDEFDLS